MIFCSHCCAVLQGRSYVSFSLASVFDPSWSFLESVIEWELSEDVLMLIAVCVILGTFLSFLPINIYERKAREPSSEKQMKWKREANALCLVLCSEMARTPVTHGFSRGTKALMTHDYYYYHSSLPNRHALKCRTKTIWKSVCVSISDDFHHHTINEKLIQHTYGRGHMEQS